MQDAKRRDSKQVDLLGLMSSCAARSADGSLVGRAGQGRAEQMAGLRGARL